MRRWRTHVAVLVAAMVAAGVAIAGCKTVPSPGPSDVPGLADQPAVPVAVHWEWDGKRKKDIEITVTYGRDGHAQPVTFTARKPDHHDETVSVPPGWAYSVTIDQQEPGHITCWLRDTRTNKFIGNGPQARNDGGSVTCRFTRMLDPA